MRERALVVIVVGRRTVERDVRALRAVCQEPPERDQADIELVGRIEAALELLDA